MKKLLSLILILSILAFVVSCGCQEEQNPDNSDAENEDLYEDKDNNGYSDIFDGELPVIPLN